MSKQVQRLSGTEDEGTPHRAWGGSRPLPQWCLSHPPVRRAFQAESKFDGSWNNRKWVCLLGWGKGGGKGEGEGWDQGRSLDFILTSWALWGSDVIQGRVLKTPTRTAMWEVYPEGSGKAQLWDVARGSCGPGRGGWRPGHWESPEMVTSRFPLRSNEVSGSQSQSLRFSTLKRSW